MSHLILQSPVKHTGNVGGTLATMPTTTAGMWQPVQHFQQSLPATLLDCNIFYILSMYKKEKGSKFTSFSHHVSVYKHKG